MFRRDASNKRVMAPFVDPPIIRITSTCDSENNSFCLQNNGNTLGQNDIVEPMIHAMMGIYYFTVNFGGCSGSFEPLIYSGFDNKIHINKFLHGDSKPTGYAMGTTTSLTSSNITVGTETVTDGNKALYSFLLYSTTGGAQTIGFTHNNCMTLKINGASLYTSKANCSQANTVSGQLTYTFVANKRYYVEAMVTQVTATTTFNLGFQSGSTITAFNSANVKRPLIFAQSANKNMRFGIGRYSTISKITYGFVFAMTGIALVVALSAGELVGKKINAAYSIIHHIQLLILTPLIGITIGINVEQFYNLIDFFLFNFNWLGNGVVLTSNNDVKPRAGFFQKNKYLPLIGLESASAFYNIGQLLFVFLVLLGVTLIVGWAYMAIKTTQNSNAKKLSTWVFQIFHFGILIRLFLLSFTFVLLCAFSEIAISNVLISQKGSWAFALILFITYIGLSLLIIGQWALTRKEETKEKLERFEEVFRGCKDTNVARLWPILWLARIFFFVVVFALLRDGSKFVTLTLGLIASILYTVAVILMKPFQEWVDYYVEIINGVMLSVYLVILYFQDKGTRWDNGFDTFYIMLIVLTVLADTILIIGTNSYSF